LIKFKKEYFKGVYSYLLQSAVWLGTPFTISLHEFGKDFI